MTPAPFITPIGFDQIQEAAQQVRAHFGLTQKSPPIRVGVVLGSGLGGLVNALQRRPNVALQYDQIPNFPTASVQGHLGALHYGFIEDVPVFILAGRVHCYEGYSASQVAFGVRVLIALGVENVVLTNAAGAINENFSVGDLMLIEDHINLTGHNPTLGPNDRRLGERFVDMSEAYSKELRDLAMTVGQKLKITLRQGVYAGVLGPSYETPAEIRMMRIMGASAVGMSTVLETIAARHGGARVLGISCQTNKAAGLSKSPLTHEEVTQSALRASDNFLKLLMALVPEVARSSGCKKV